MTSNRIVAYESPKRSFEPSNADVNACTDVFPVLADVEPRRLAVEIPTSTAGVLSFVNLIRGEKVYFHMGPSESWTLNIKRLFVASQRCNAIEFDRLDDWARMENRLRAMPADEIQKRHNEDVRLGFRWNNTFLVKAYFTFGYRRPERGTVHLIQTSAAPIIYFLYNPENRHSKRMNKRRRTSDHDRFLFFPRAFSRYDHHHFDMYVLQPFSMYKIREDRTYLLVTCQKTLFTVDVVSKSFADDLERKGRFKYGSPTADTRLRPNSTIGYRDDKPNTTPVWRMPEEDVPQWTDLPQYIEEPCPPIEQERAVQWTTFIIPEQKSFVDAAVNTEPTSCQCRKEATKKRTTGLGIASKGIRADEPEEPEESEESEELPLEEILPMDLSLKPTEYDDISSDVPSDEPKRMDELKTFLETFENDTTTIVSLDDLIF